VHKAGKQNTKPLAITRAKTQLISLDFGGVMGGGGEVLSGNGSDVRAGLTVPDGLVHHAGLCTNTNLLTNTKMRLL
jgi:hypothetical protein